MVGCDILPPEGGVGLGPDGVERAVMPEAAVDEIGELVCMENEVGLYPEDSPFCAVGRQPERNAAAPDGGAVGAHGRHQSPLYVLVPFSANAGHEFLTSQS